MTEFESSEPVAAPLLRSGARVRAPGTYVCLECAAGVASRLVLALDQQLPICHVCGVPTLWARQDEA